MRDYILSKSKQHDILGELYIRQNILNTLQLNIVKNEISKPSYEYNVDFDSAWQLYNNITLALKESRPANWMSHQIKVHELFATLMDIEDPIDEIVPIKRHPRHQMTIFEVIEEVEKENELLEEIDDEEEISLAESDLEEELTHHEFFVPSNQFPFNI